MVPVVTLSLFLALSYAILIFLAAAGFRRMAKGHRDEGGVPVTGHGALPARKKRLTGDRGGMAVSIVVPFRNEEVGLPGLIGDLLAQTDPGVMYEVILVNDHSTDRSKRVAETMLDGNQGYRILDLPEESQGKKAALAYGIERAAGRWILQTDADCRLRPAFLAERMAYLAGNASDLSAGLVTAGRQRGGFTETFERLDMLSLAFAGAGSFALGRPLMCSGANLLYSRELYGQTRRFDPLERIPSGDDMFLLIGARKLGRSISFCFQPETIVETAPVGNFAALVRQRIRWASKSPFYRMADIQVTALLVGLTNLSMLLLPLWIVLFPGAGWWLAGAGVLKTAADFYLLRVATGFTSCRRDFLFFLPVTLFYYPFQFLVLAGSLVRKSSWKGRRLLPLPDQPFQVNLRRCMSRWLKKTARQV